MAKYTGSKCRQCRREGGKLYLKGEKCFTSKCPVENRPFPPGQHGQRRTRLSDYATQLREKQKVKRMYGLSEKQFHLFFERADSQKGITGTNLLVLLERRLDNVVYRLGFTNSRAQARQFVRHRHFLVNGKRVNIPSYLVKKGDEITIREKSQKIKVIQEALEVKERQGWDSHIEVDVKNFKGILKELPDLQDLQLPVEEQLIVEFYSR